jgi:hypothetical protein
LRMAMGNASPIVNHRGNLFADCISDYPIRVLTLFWLLGSKEWRSGGDGGVRRITNAQCPVYSVCPKLY